MFAHLLNALHERLGVDIARAVHEEAERVRVDICGILMGGPREVAA